MAGASITEWARQNAALHTAIRITPGTFGLQVEATAPIRAGELLLTIPGELLITSNSARRATRQLGLSTEGVQLVHEEAHVAMAIWLLNATSHPQAAPRHADWLLALPASFDCTIEWSPEELAELQASTAAQRAKQLRTWADAEHSRLFAPSVASKLSRAWRVRETLLLPQGQPRRRRLRR